MSKTYFPFLMDINSTNVFKQIIIHVGNWDCDIWEKGGNGGIDNFTTCHVSSINKWAKHLDFYFSKKRNTIGQWIH